ncbi:Alkylated DNA repair protein alkB-8-like protein [Morus notabilis]|uniref:Alkylated DNA repair protein alkB-8-like protein n=1 Tax=Morus notabilis TaxID=981085 RepID=W9QLR5_9ROSA|nr:uncharacterized protein P8A3.02c [Morus notabilis]EXB40846.1 Alkylated DNA repair protein alkB-8-like protein [Morus notabilis]
MEADKAILIEVFGESSGSEEEEGSQPKSRYCWERFGEIKGLWLCRDFLSTQRQSSLLSAIQNEGWFSEASNNQAMRFGELQPWAIEISDSIRDAVISSHQDVDLDHPMELGSCNGLHEASPFPFPSHLLSRNPLFDQLIVNLYHPGEGICAHVDLMRFEDGIAIVSLESSCVMHFNRVDEGTTSDKDHDNAQSMNMKIPVYLTPGSLVLMYGEARYVWKHEINRKPGFQKWKGQELQQKRRISITLRKLAQVD